MRSEFVEINDQNIGVFFVLYGSVFNEAPWNDGWHEDAVRERLETFVQFPRFYGLGYVADSAPVALVFGWSERWIHGWHFHLKEMCVSTPLQRQGLGRILLTELESRLVSRGVQRIFLESGESLPARRFYEVLGYRPLSFVSLAKSIEG